MKAKNTDKYSTNYSFGFNLHMFTKDFLKYLLKIEEKIILRLVAFFYQRKIFWH